MGEHRADYILAAYICVVASIIFIAAAVSGYAVGYAEGIRVGQDHAIITVTEGGADGR